MESIWKNISDNSPSLSDSASLDVMLSVDSPKSPKSKNKCKLFKKSEKKNTEKNNKSKLKNNKQNKKGQKVTKDVSEQSFTNMPLEFLKKIKLINNNIDREETCGKSSPSSTVNDDCEVKKNNKDCEISQTLPILHSDQQFPKNNVNLKETIEERGSSNSSNEKSNTLLKDRDCENNISLNYKKCSEDISKPVNCTEKSEFDPLSSKININENSAKNCIETLGVSKSENHFETASLEGEKLDVSHVVANDTSCQQVSECIKEEIINDSNFVVKDNNICEDQSFSKLSTLCETITNGQEEKSTNSNANSVLEASFPSYDKDSTRTTPFVEIRVKNSLEINDQGESSKEYKTANIFTNNQNSFRKEINICNPPGPDTTNCTIKDVSVNQNSKVDDSENVIKTTEQFLISNTKIINLVEPEKTPSPSVDLHSIPKSENIRSDCMFEKSIVQAPKTDYSICGLLKPHVIIKNEQDMREYDLDNPEGHSNILVKRDFSIYLRDINEKSISPKPAATVETETELHFNTNKQHGDRKNCKESPLPYSSNNQNFIKDLNYENTLNKDLNTCLLHKILGEEDCLKNPSSECLFAKANLEKSLSNDVLDRLTDRQDSTANSVPAPVHISLKHWQNSSDIIKNEKVDGKAKNYGCIRAKSFSNEEKCSRSISSEITTKSTTDVLPQENEPDNLEFVLRNECDNFNSTYDYESEEDSNLVIDEDFDPVKEHNESDVEETRFAVSCISNVNETLNNIPVNSIPDLREEVCKELVTRNETVKNLHYLEVQKQNEILASGQEVLVSDRQSSSCHSLDMKEITINKTSHVNNFCVKENKTSNNNSASKNLSRKRDHSLLLPEKSNLNIKEPRRESTFSPSKIIKVVDFKTLHVNKPSSTEKLSSSTHPQVNNTIFMPIEQPTSSKFSVENNPPLITENRYSNFQHQIKQPVCDSVISVNNSLLSPKIPTKPIPQEINIYGSFNNFNPENKECIATNNSRLPPFEQFNKLKPVVNEKYQDLNLNMDTHDKLIKVPTYQDSTTVKFVTSDLHTGVRNHIQSGVASYSVKLPSRGTKQKQTYSKKQEKLEAHQQLKSAQMLYDTNPVQDPLCLVVNKNKEITRESLYDFVFPVAHEVEVYSAPDSEITHPDWPIANEQSVDSSNPMQYSPTTDQYSYSSNLKCDQYCGTSENDQNCLVNSLELQQVSVDFRYPENVGKGFNKDKFNLHRRTLEVDYNLCCSQRKFKEFYLSQDVPPSIPVPYPPQGRTDLKSSVRCSCDQCSDNHQILLRNYNLLTNFRNSKVKPLSLYPKINDIFPSDRDLSCESDCSFDSSLPLKKRKTLTNSKPPEELTSYPNTPMMSIAQLELANYEQRNQVIVTNPQSHWKDTQDPRHALYLPPCPTLQQTVLDTDTKQNKRKSGKRRKSSR
ncbi:hypothetical protein J6590_046911 [Homalodisca vitripennis]|nr:hypothetical protein J6590_046911 [Homalodisca vitripennis]